MKTPNNNSSEFDYLKRDLSDCKLCEWRCGVNRLNGEIGVCGITIPEVYSSHLHPAPPASFDAFLTGCSFRCLACQNWTVANYPSNDYCEVIEGYYSPHSWAVLAVAALNTAEARGMGADRLFFTGGEPTCSLPWVEAVVSASRSIEPRTKVNFDTNGYMTEDSLKRVLAFADSITYDIKAFDEGLFRALTGADVHPVLRNAETIARTAPERLWEFRILVIPELHDADVTGLCGYLAELDPELPVNFLAFRPNFVLDEHNWARRSFMDKCVETARKAGLLDVSWSGKTASGSDTAPDKNAIQRNILDEVSKIAGPRNTAIAMGHARTRGCIQKERRDCGKCKSVHKCALKRYTTDKFN